MFTYNAHKFHWIASNELRMWITDGNENHKVRNNDSVPLSIIITGTSAIATNIHSSNYPMSKGHYLISMRRITYNEGVIDYFNSLSPSYQQNWK